MLYLPDEFNEKTLQKIAIPYSDPFTVPEVSALLNQTYQTELAQVYALTQEKLESTQNYWVSLFPKIETFYSIAKSKKRGIL